MASWIGTGGSNPGDVATSGSLGVGTTSPASKLTVQADNNGGRGGELSIVNAGGSSAGTEAALNFGCDNSTFAGDAGNAQIKARNTGTGDRTDLIFSLWSGSAFTDFQLPTIFKASICLTDKFLHSSRYRFSFLVLYRALRQAWTCLCVSVLVMVLPFSFRVQM